MTTNLERFKKCNDKWAVVKAEWTENGRTIKTDNPKNWNYMRVKMESGEKFLLHDSDVKKAGKMRWKDIDN